MSDGAIHTVIWEERRGSLAHLGAARENFLKVYVSEPLKNKQEFIRQKREKGLCVVCLTPTHTTDPAIHIYSVLN